MKQRRHLALERWDAVDAANALVGEYCAVTPRLTFVDLNPATHDEKGEPWLELYRDNKLHFKPAACAAFTAAIKRALEKIWAEASPPGK